MNKKKIALIVGVLVLLAAFFALDLGRYLSLGYLKSSQSAFASLYAAQPLTVGQAPPGTPAAPGRVQPAIR